VGQDREEDPGRAGRFRQLAELEKQRAKLRLELGVLPTSDVEGGGTSEIDPAIFRLIANAATDFLSVHAADGSYVYASPSCARLFGWQPTEMVGRSAYEFLHPSDVDSVAEHHGAHDEVEDAPSIVYRLLKKDASYAWVETHARAYRDEKGRDRIVCITHDVTERRALEEQREQLIAELQERVAQVQTLSGLLPICAWCRSVRDDAGFWEQVERYIEKTTNVEFTHSICPSCAEKLSSDTG